MVEGRSSLPPRLGSKSRKGAELDRGDGARRAGLRRCCVEYPSKTPEFAYLAEFDECWCSCCSWISADHCSLGRRSLLAYIPVHLFLLSPAPSRTTPHHNTPHPEHCALAILPKMTTTPAAAPPAHEKTGYFFRPSFFTRKSSAQTLPSTPAAAVHNHHDQPSFNPLAGRESRISDTRVHALVEAEIATSAPTLMMNAFLIALMQRSDISATISSKYSPRSRLYCSLKACTSPIHQPLTMLPC